MPEQRPGRPSPDPTNGAPPQGGAPAASRDDGSLVTKTLDWVLSVLNALGSIWIFVLMVMIDSDATGRTFFTHPINGVNELVELSIVGIVFLQLGDATRRGKLTRSDGAFKAVFRRSPVTGRALGALFEFLGVLFIVIVLWGAVPDMIEAWERDYYVGEQGLFTAPEWPIKVVIVIGCLITGLQFLRIGIAYLRRRHSPLEEHEIAVE